MKDFLFGEQYNYKSFACDEKVSDVNKRLRKKEKQAIGVNDLRRHAVNIQCDRNSTEAQIEYSHTENDIKTINELLNNYKISCSIY